MTLRRAAILCLLALLCCWAALPFVWAILTSLRSGAALFETSLFPSQPTLRNFVDILTEGVFTRNLWNSILVSTAAAASAALLSVVAAYPLSRSQFRGRRLMLMAFLLVSMFPQIAILSGLFELIRALGLFNSRWSLALSYLVLTLPLSTWTLTAFMRELPKSLEEAARVDGAGALTIVLRIFVPILGPSLVTTLLLGFIAAWNEFLFALTFTVTDAARPVPVAIAMMSGASEHEIPWGKIMAASVIVTVPIVGLVLFLQRRIVAGLTAGAVKG